MDKIITVLGYKNFITELSDAPDGKDLDDSSYVKNVTILK